MSNAAGYRKGDKGKLARTAVENVEAVDGGQAFADLDKVAPDAALAAAGEGRTALPGAG